MENLPPFYVGQEVMALRNHTQSVFKKGQTFTVFNIHPSECACNGWDIDIGIPMEGEFWRCRKCERIGQHTKSNRLFNSSYFAPIEKFKAVSFTKIMEDIEISVN